MTELTPDGLPKPQPVWLPPQTIEMRMLNAIERIELLIKGYIEAQQSAKVPSMNQTTIKPQGKKR